MDTRIVYATSHDGVRVACSVRASSFPLIYLHVPLFSNCRSLGSTESSVRFKERLMKRGQLIMVDLRGSGLADRHPPSQTFEDCMADLEAIYAALKIERADILAFGARGSMAIRFAWKNPERVRRLFIWGTSSGPTPADGVPMASPGFRYLVANDWPLFLQTFVARNAISEKAVPALLTDIERNSDQEDVLAFLDCLRETNIEGEAALLRCPTLVAELDATTLRDAGHAPRLAAMIPNSELVYLPNKALFGWTEELADAIERFDAMLDAAERTRGVDASLSPRELEVLQKLVAGETNAGISEALAISRSTVDRHVANIYAKAGVHNRAEVVRWALTHSLV